VTTAAGAAERDPATPDAIRRDVIVRDLTRSLLPSNREIAAARRSSLGASLGVTT
jgi:hypothetical protein